jgi:hypothetical protein
MSHPESRYIPDEIKGEKHEAKPHEILHVVERPLPVEIQPMQVGNLIAYSVSEGSGRASSPERTLPKPFGFTGRTHSFAMGQFNWGIAPEVFSGSLWEGLRLRLGIAQELTRALGPGLAPIFVSQYELNYLIRRPLYGILRSTIYGLKGVEHFKSVEPIKLYTETSLSIEFPLAFRVKGRVLKATIEGTEIFHAYRCMPSGFYPSYWGSHFQTKFGVKKESLTLHLFHDGWLFCSTGECIDHSIYGPWSPRSDVHHHYEFLIMKYLEDYLPNVICLTVFDYMYAWQSHGWM